MSAASQILAQTMDMARVMTYRYINRIKNSDLKKQIIVGDVKMNCAHWIIAHLAWSENQLVLFATGGKTFDKAWLDDFKIGSSAEPKDSWASADIILNDMNEIHTASINHIATLSDVQLEEPNLSSFHFNGDNTKRMLIQHAIRHEGMHCGHLSWLCKMQGLK